jgi:4-diphosphocytidyl-2-C-methyl-D-erythritol kinase
MGTVRQANPVLVHAPAKVNLFLEVLGKRTDGYHDICTCMVAVNLFDTLEIKEGPSEAIRLTCSDPSLSTGPDNLVWRAADLLRRHVGLATGVHIHLTKQIPAAAGLAGGSSDAAATLAGLNRLWRLDLSARELAGLAAQLGSDIPFFCLATSAWCAGRGERVEPFELRKRLVFVLVCPAAALTTADVYAGTAVPQVPRSSAAMRQALALGDAESVGRQLFNRLQDAAEKRCPAVTELRQLLGELSPAGQLMSGSGSTVYALCRDEANAQELSRRLQQRLQASLPPGEQPKILVVTSLAGGEDGKVTT